MSDPIGWTERRVEGFGTSATQPMMPGFYKDQNGDLVAAAMRVPKDALPVFIEWIKKEFGL